MHKRGVFAQLTITPISMAVGLLSYSALTLVAQTVQPPTVAAVYQDRLIQGAALEDADIADKYVYDSTGLPRSYSLEALWSQQKSAASRQISQGLKATGFADTAFYGSLSGQLSLQSTGSSLASSYVLRQIGMPFEGGWRADNAIGMVNLPTTDLARASPRLAIPAPAMLGATTQWQQAQDLSFTGGWGRAGSFSGFPSSGFSVGEGNYAMLGLQKNERQTDGLWQWGGMLAQASGVNSAFASGLVGGKLLNAQAGYVAVRREWAGSTNQSSPQFLQFNLLTSSNSGSDFSGKANPRASGIWVDGGLALGQHQHSGGLFVLQPGLGWLDLPTISDLQGGYWRHNWRNREWSVESALELLAPVAGNAPSGFFASNSVRYQYTNGISMGAVLNLRRYGIESQSALLYTQFANTFGTTRAQVELATARTGERQIKAQIDHDWTAINALRLSTSLSVDQDRTLNLSGFNRTRGVGWAVNADWDLGQHFSLLTTLAGRSTHQQTQYTLSAGLNWRISPHWSLQANANVVQGNINGVAALAQSPLTIPATAPSRSQDIGVFLSLRYSGSAGQPSRPLGAAPGAAAGQLNGSVYLDDNKNAKRDAAERSAANVTVLLDGRFATQTDAQGRFEFPFVAAGPHILTVISDNLPLPWSLDKDGRTETRVYARETTTVDIGAIKP